MSRPGCYLRILIIGGGGIATVHEGAGSGHITYVREVTVMHSRTYHVIVGYNGQASSIDGMVQASPGEGSYDGHGGGGYSGG